jgi:hypothetical protein
MINLVTLLAQLLNILIIREVNVGGIVRLNDFEQYANTYVEQVYILSFERRFDVQSRVIAVRFGSVLSIKLTLTAR